MTINNVLTRLYNNDRKMKLGTSGHFEAVCKDIFHPFKVHRPSLLVAIKHLFC